MYPEAQYTDQDLFRLITKSDEEAFSELFRRYDRRIYPFVLKMIKVSILAEEITQEIFIKIWKNREKLDAVENPQAYILTMAARQTLDQIKKNLNESKMLERLAAGLKNHTYNETDETLLLRDRVALIQQAVDQLPPQQRSVYQLSRQEGMNYEEIGHQLNISPNTVRNHLVRALQFLRTYLQNHDELPVFLLIGAWLIIKR